MTQPIYTAPAVKSSAGGSVLSLRSRVKRSIRSSVRRLGIKLGLVFDWMGPRVSKPVQLVSEVGSASESASLFGQCESPPEILTLYVNGTATSATLRDSSGLRHRYDFDPAPFELGENLVGLRFDERLKPDLVLLPQSVLDGRRHQQEQPTVAASASSRDLALFHICRAVAHPMTRFSGLAPGCFDVDRGCYRLLSWIWTNGALVRALLQGDSRHIALAQSLGEAFLRFQIHNGPNEGAFPVRWDPSHGVPEGFVEWYAPNDAAFLASYGLCSLYRRFGDDRYLTAALRVGEWILRSGLHPDGRLSVGFRSDRKQWDDDWLYADAGFVVTLFRDLAQITGEPKWVEAATRFLNWFIPTFLDRRAGYVYVSVVRTPTGRFRPIRRQFARGQAWALDGILAGWELTGRADYLDTAKTIADHLLATQVGDGSWSYLLDRPDTGPCNKGTPVIGWHLARLFAITGLTEYRRAAVDALHWCESAQVTAGSVVEAVGGIAARNAEGAISGELGICTTFPYGAAFFVLLKDQLADCRTF